MDLWYWCYSKTFSPPLLHTSTKVQIVYQRPTKTALHNPHYIQSHRDLLKKCLIHSFKTPTSIIFRDAIKSMLVGLSKYFARFIRVVYIWHKPGAYYRFTVAWPKAHLWMPITEHTTHRASIQFRDILQKTSCSIPWILINTKVFVLGVSGRTNTPQQFFCLNIYVMVAQCNTFNPFDPII